MLNNKPIRLKVATRRDFTLVVSALCVLGILAALLSPYPVWSTIFAILLIGVGQTTHVLEFSKTNNVKLTSVIFPDGRVRLEFNREDTIEGFLDGQQWSTHWFTVLRFSNGDTTRKLVIRSAQQQGTNDYRRLKMWLRNDLCSNTRPRQVLDS